MTTIMEALRLEHANTARLLDLLEYELAKGADGDFHLVKSIADYLLTYPDKYHHPKEDLVYRALLAAEPEEGAPLDDLEAEHIELAERTEELALAVKRILAGREEAGPWFENLTESFIRFYRQHIAKEESGFFLEAERVLDAETFMELESRVMDVSDPLFDDHAADRLAQLRTGLASAPRPGNAERTTAR